MKGVPMTYFDSVKIIKKKNQNKIRIAYAFNNLGWCRNLKHA